MDTQNPINMMPQAPSDNKSGSVGGLIAIIIIVVIIIAGGIYIWSSKIGPRIKSVQTQTTESTENIEKDLSTNTDIDVSSDLTNLDQEFQTK